jgi:hypothetical protein
MLNSRIVIIDCCGMRFSKVIGFWFSEPIAGEKITLDISTNVLWGDVHVEQIFPKGHMANPYELDVVFTISEDERLFDCLCNHMGKEGWLEKEGACQDLPTIR